uniref:Ligand-dependent nuclear receptor corepressor-like protein n=1 Tax=Gouania willdenowi TaxID=441366 RepID=A0A8C5NHU7_GOUWI
MATVPCIKCTAERRGFRRELDSWRHKLLHCIGFESILKGIYGPMLMRDLNLFADCEPEDVDDWSLEGSCSKCSFCNLGRRVFFLFLCGVIVIIVRPETTLIVASSLITATFFLIDMPPSCNSNIPLIAQELMRKMIHQFALEYASECLLHPDPNGATCTPSPQSEASDVPLDLTVTRTQEEKEITPAPEELHCLEQQGKSRCVLDSVLSTLCQAHRSLLYQILKLAHHHINHNPVGQTNSHCGMHPQTIVTPHSVALVNYSLCNHSADRDHYGNVETYSVLCSKRVHCHSCQNCINGRTVNRLSPCELSPALSQSPVYCAHSSTLSLSPQICCCKLNHQCHLDSIRNCSIQSLSTGEHDVGKQDPTHLVLKREQSPSPPPLSPIYSEIVKKTDDKPPSLLYHEQREQTDTVIQDDIVHGYSSQTELGHSGTSLQDLMKRFSEKLETIKPSDKDPNLFSTAIYASEEEQQSPTTSQNLQFHADAHLTEIITTVLHTGCASDYSLSELFNHHQNREPKSPNTRSRRRQEVLAAIAKPTDDASTRRHSLQIKRELAMLDQSCNKRKKKRAHLKDGSVIETVSNALSDPLSVTKASEKEVTGVVFLEKPEGIVETFNNSFPAKIARKDLKEECQMVAIAEVKQIKTELNISEPSNEETEPTVSNTHKDTPGLHYNCCKCISEGDCFDTQVITNIANLADESRIPPQNLTEHSSNGSIMKHEDSSIVHSCDIKNGAAEDKDQSPVWKKQRCQSNYFKGERRSRRKIVPPQRFSSYVTEPRNTFFVACFSEGVFNRGVQKEESLIPSTIHMLSIDSEVNGNQFKSLNKECLSLPETTNEKRHKVQHELFDEHSKNHRQSFSETVAADKRNPEKHSPHRTERREKFIVDDCNVMPVGRLRSSTRKLQVIKEEESSSDLNLSIGSTTSIGANPSDKQDQYTSPIKLMFISPMNDTDGLRFSLKSGSQTEHFDPCEESSWSGSPQRHRGPCKKSSASPFSSSPIKSACLLRSATSSPKNDPGRSGEEGPSKQNHRAESERSPKGLPSFHETSPLKRRPGRPKKLGPPLEQKLKKPIGRPRKEKIDDSVPKANSVNEHSLLPSGTEECVTKSLKITVMCGRSRKNKRTVTECSDQLQTEFNCVKQPVESHIDYGSLLHNSKTSLGIITKNPEELNILSSEKEPTPQVTHNINCQDSSIPSRKPGRPPKVKISGISVTITMSPQQRKIQFNKDNYLNPETTIQRKVLLKSPRKSHMIHPHLPCDQNEAEEVMDIKAKIKDERPNPPVALRQSLRVRKPSIHFLRAVATSSFRSYSRSNALLRRSKQLLLNKASNERRLEEQLTHSELPEVAKHFCGEERSNLPDLSGIAEVSVDPIFAPKKTIKWWAASAEENELNQELARRIRIFSDTWIIDTEENQHKGTARSPSLGAKAVKPFTRTSKQNSVVRTLFDCPPDKPSSCSMQQISSWFMQTTETQPLAIVKKKTRNHYDPAQFSRSINKTVVCPSPQAERLKKHLKKFAKTVPKSPLEHQAAQRLSKFHLSRLKVRRRLFTLSFPMTLDSGVWWRRSSAAGKLHAVLFRARKRFLTLREREQKKWMDKSNANVAHLMSRRNINRLQTRQNTSCKSPEGQSPNCTKSRPFISAVCRTHPVKVHKEQHLSTKAWSSGMLKECRVFLKKINSPDHKLAEKVSGSHTLGERSSSQYLLAESKRKSKQPGQDVKTVRKLKIKKAASSQVESSLSKKDLEWNKRQKVVLSDEPLQPPPTRLLRPSRTRRLTGAKWSDFVFGNYLALFD